MSVFLYVIWLFLTEENLAFIRFGEPDKRSFWYNEYNHSQERHDMEIVEKAPAKINLGLDIVGKRQDGFHELSMIMVSVDLNDYITITEIAEDQVIVNSNSCKLPLNSKNDVCKAAQLLKERYQISTGLEITLQKSIPICAGLGGGSSDAAATLRALNRLWELKLSEEELIEIGFKIGSDVPYCIKGGCALISGKGEIVENLPCSLSAWVVLVKPDFGISTRTIFKEIDTETISRVNIDALKEAILTNSYEDVLQFMGNSLEDITIARKPFIQKLRIVWISAVLIFL